MRVLGLVAWVAAALCLAALIEMAGSVMDHVSALEAPMVPADVVRLTVERDNKRILIDLAETPADYLVCLGADCGFPLDWDRRAAERAAQ